jgi:hypothetical protein
MMINLAAWGAIVKGNIFDFAAGGPLLGNHTPYNNPLEQVFAGSGSDSWPLPNCVGIAVKGNQIIISDNIFRNANPAGSASGNPNVIGISVPSSFPPPLQGTDTTRVIVKGNMFDGTIGVPIQDNSSGSDGLLGVRITDNIGVNPAGALNATLVGSSPPNGTVFANPYPYDCLVNITAGAVVTVKLYAVPFGTIAASQVRVLLVKAGGTIELSWTLGAAAPTWIWAGM